MSFKKYYKFVISLILVLSISMPYITYASFEGANFLTRAEFESAMSDFNARIASCELSINSKIDSQVSSYLDRNGIWKGKDIDLVNNTILYGVKADTSTITRNYLNFAGSDMVVESSDILRKLVIVGDTGEFLLASNVGKTGLAFFVTKGGNVIHNDMRTVVATVRPSTPGNQCINTANARWIYRVVLSLFAGDWDTKAGIARYRISAQFVAGGSSLEIVCPELLSGTIIFFTRTGEDMWYEIEEIIDDNSTNIYGNAPCTLYALGETSNSQSSREFIFESGAIY